MVNDDLGLLGGDPEGPDRHARSGDNQGWRDQHRALPQRHDVVGEVPRRGRSRTESRKATERRTAARRRRRTGSVVAVVLVLVLAGGVYFGGRSLLGGLGFGDSGPSDFTGSGVSDVVVQVKDGDSTREIGATLVADGVVASASLFTSAAASNPAIATIQPGYYQLRTRLPAGDAVTRLVSKQARVGDLVLPEGLQLADVKGKTGKVTDGILTRIQKASCVELNGKQRCTSRKDLQTAAATADLASLGVPSWALKSVSAVKEKDRRLEGLIRPGSYDLKPGAPATVQLTQLLTSSAGGFAKLGLPDLTVAGLNPYQVLVVASLVQREALPADFSKVARVVYNRLAVKQKLEFDSTVNYPLDVQAVATTPGDRADVTPWNTYATAGLPQTPIASPSDGALTAAEKPAAGRWLYFVTVDTKGTTVFSDTFPEHEKAIQRAQANGVFG
ncbi:MAG: endolytic transglycosylase MltG [Mycobacteriaceae bacterium]